MKPVGHIGSLFALLVIYSNLLAQSLGIVCAGDTGLIYRVKGNAGSTFEWNVEGGMIVSDWGDSIAVNWGKKSGEFEIKVQEISKYGCPALPVTGNVFVSAPNLDLGGNIDICEGESVEIETLGTYKSYLWQDHTKKSYLVTSTEGYKTVTVTDENGCQATDKLYLTVHPRPYVDLGPDTSSWEDEGLVLDAGTDGIRYNWSTGENSQNIKVYGEEQSIWVEVTNEHNCSSYDTIQIKSFLAKNTLKDMPTAFTPNGDGKNDVWRIPQLESFPHAVVEIFDRWGNLIYRSQPGYTNVWDGYSSDGRKMPMDSYYFVIDTHNKKTEPFAGTVTILK